MATVLVTGANRGIGLELVRQLRARGDDVIATVRRDAAELEQLGARVEHLEVTESASREQLAQRLAGVSIDVLIHCAGVLTASSLESFDVDAARHMMEVNALAPVALTSALLPNLGAGSKVAIITSRMGSMADNTSGGAYGYRMSKAAVNAAGRSLSIDLAPRDIAVVLLHPGWVRTDMTHGRGLMDADESAAGLIARVDALSMATTGTFFHQSGEPLPW